MLRLYWNFTFTQQYMEHVDLASHFLFSHISLCVLVPGASVRAAKHSEAVNSSLHYTPWITLMITAACQLHRAHPGHHDWYVDTGIQKNMVRGVLARRMLLWMFLCSCCETDVRKSTDWTGHRVCCHLVSCHMSTLCNLYRCNRVRS